MQFERGMYPARTGWLGSVALTGLQDDDVVIRDVVNQSVRIVDAAGPRAREDMPEGFGLADTSERIA